MTALGGVAVLSLVTLGVAGYPADASRKYHAMWLVLVATFGGLLISTGLKWIVDRDRPDIVEHLSHVYTLKLPQRPLDAVGGRVPDARQPARRGSCRGSKEDLLLGVALFLTFLVGVSRVYMGVH